MFSLGFFYADIRGVGGAVKHVYEALSICVLTNYLFDNREQAPANGLTFIRAWQNETSLRGWNISTGGRNRHDFIIIDASNKQLFDINCKCLICFQNSVVQSVYSVRQNGIFIGI